MTRNLSLLVLGGVLAVLLALVAACGGGDDDDDAAGDNTNATVTATRTTEPSADNSDDEEDEDETATPTEANDGGDDDDSGDDSSNGFLGEEVDVCTLLTPQEINDITGFDVDSRTDTSFEPFWSCDWAEDVGSTVSISVYTGTQNDLDTVFDLGGGEPVEDLGEGANWRTTFAQVLDVLTDKYVFSVYVTSPVMDEEEAKSTSIDLAEVVIDRLP